MKVTFDSTELRELVAEIVREEIARLAPPQPSAWMTVDEAAAYLRCSRQRIFDLRSAGVLTAHHEGRRALCSRAEVEALVANGAGYRRRST